MQLKRLNICILKLIMAPEGQNIARREEKKWGFFKLHKKHFPENLSLKFTKLSNEKVSDCCMHSSNFHLVTVSLAMISPIKILEINYVSPDIAFGKFILIYLFHENTFISLQC